MSLSLNCKRECKMLKWGSPKYLHPSLNPSHLSFFPTFYTHLISHFLKMSSTTGINRPSMFSSHIIVDNWATPPVAIARPLHLFSPPHAPPLRKLNANSLTCCGASPPNIINHGYDLYDLLGVDSSSNQNEIKSAYRSLQKRCHPDIAGNSGHDMAIILNEAYSVLSDPSSRSLYDKEVAKAAEFRGYTGKPLYSTWLGPEWEDRAVFVDEVKCVGCLKCALFANKTFAIEPVYGRARVVGQWADPEHQIQQAIQSCPVDCISMVERSKLAVLEFLMAKQPRGNVRVGASNAVGTRVSNIFFDANKFESRCNELKDKAKQASETDLQREARMSAIQAIRKLTNWWYWQPPTSSSYGNSNANTTKARRILALIPEKSTRPSVEKLHQAAAKRRQKATSHNSPQFSATKAENSEDYWTPNTILPITTQKYNLHPTSSISDSTHETELKGRIISTQNIGEEWPNPFNSNIPIVIASFAACVTGLQGGGQTSGGLKEHIGGNLMLEVVNSPLLQIFLTFVTWYFVGVALVGLVYATVSKKADR